jgi:uncharacterized repeat protein (TIGR03837 family)
MQLHWDIFCRVIDNYGDIGVCWRLARQLADEHGKKVRLWVDDLSPLKQLCPEIDTNSERQFWQEIEIVHWTEKLTADRVADVVIEAFACDVPEVYLQKMAAASPKPSWINLEYLTAENWAEDCHGMASPHPALPLSKYFFFPGFSSRTGGLLREQGLLTRYPQHTSNRTLEYQLEISLFCYETAPVAQLIEALSQSTKPICLHLAPGKPYAAVAAHLGGTGPWQLGLLNILPFDFLSQDEYDRLLWRCDINFIRGEDSFVRAQWTGKPFVWQIYQQEESAHLVKLDAFLERHTQQWPEGISNATVHLFKTWNSGGDLSLAWNEYIAHLPEIADHTLNWRNQLASYPDLTNTLVKFCAGKV